MTSFEIYLLIITLVLFVCFVFAYSYNVRLRRYNEEKDKIIKNYEELVKEQLNEVEHLREEIEVQTILITLSKSIIQKITEKLKDENEEVKKPAPKKRKPKTEEVKKEG